MAGLLDRIEEDLEEIVTEDIRRTVDRLAPSANGYAKGAAARLRAGPDDDCSDDVQISGSVSLRANGETVAADGAQTRERYDCMQEEWRINEWSLSHNRVAGFGGQTVLEYSHRRERFKTENHVTGRYVSLYASRTVDPARTSGKIDGLGVAAGLYGARLLKEDLVLDYNLGAAAGRHAFSLAFLDADGITATGAAQYIAVFGGLGLSGEFQRGDTIFAPRVSLEVAHVLPISTDVTATLAAAREDGQSRLDGFTRGRLLAELAIANDIDLAHDGEGLWDGLDMKLTITPSVFCDGETVRGAECGMGVSVAIDGASQNGRARTTGELHLEKTRTRSSYSVKLEHHKRLDWFENAEASQSIALSQEGDMEVGFALTADW